MCLSYLIRSRAFESIAMVSGCNRMASPMAMATGCNLHLVKTRSPEGVAQDAAPGAWRLGYHQVVGAVFLTLRKKPSVVRIRQIAKGFWKEKPFHICEFLQKRLFDSSS